MQACHPASARPPFSAEVTKANLADKIAQLNAAIDDVSAQLKSNDGSLSKEEVSA